MLQALDFARLGAVYIHLIACCVALGAILASDAEMLVRIIQGRKESTSAHMHHLMKTVSVTLVVLWITGLFFIVQDSLNTGMVHTLSNPKLQAKIIVVVLLTINGVLLHFNILPMITRVGSVLNLLDGQRMFAICCGALSGVSWMYAAFLGMARPLSWKYSLPTILVMYPLLITAGCAGMWLLTSWSVNRKRQIVFNERARLHEMEEQVLHLPPGSAKWRKAAVHRDAHAQYRNGFYSVPFWLIGCELWLRVTDTTVTLYHRQDAVATHYVVPMGQRSTDMAHLPSAAQAMQMHHTQLCLAHAKQVGPACHALVGTVFSGHPMLRLREVEALLQLKKSFSAAQLEAACLRASHDGRPGYKLVKRHLQRAQEQRGWLSSIGETYRHHLHDPVIKKFHGKPSWELTSQEPQTLTFGN